MDQSTVIAVASVIGLLVTVASSYIAYSKGSKKDSKQEGKEQGTIEASISNMQMNITYITKQNDNLLFEQREANKNHNALAERVTRVEESSKQAHLRINTIEERVDKM